MEEMCSHGQQITFVEPGSPADRCGVRQGERLVLIGGMPVHDIIDYEYLTAEAALTLTLLDENDRERSISVSKTPEEPLGLSFATSLMSPVRTCRNHCVFCFIDQMPKGVRTSLAFKDDDWRLSFIMGNYVTLTNIDDAEFDRIVSRRVSPLYVSVHATDGQIRQKMMRNPSAVRIMERLTALQSAGLHFHAQIVLCPGLNDGAVLDQTIGDLIRLKPSCRSVAVVPVGLTKYREGLYPLSGFTREQAAAVIRQVRAHQAQCLKTDGKAFVYLSDEWYLLAGEPLPAYAHYADFPQIENGVGLLRLFEHDFCLALSERRKRTRKHHFSAAGGTYAVPFCSALYERLQGYHIWIDAFAIQNNYFGEQIGVAGLVTGQDLVRQLHGKPLGEALLIPHAMLRECEDVFLDGMTLRDAERALGVRIKPFCDGEDFIQIIFGR